MRRKPRVNVNCVASRYAGPNERIVEYSNGKSGGLISLVTLDDGTLRVELYRHDAEVSIVVGQGETDNRPWTVEEILAREG